MFDGQRIFRAHINDAVRGADGQGGDDHPFKDGVGIALQHAPVHISAGISFVRVADNVFRAAGLHVAGQFPFFSGQESCAAAPAQFGVQDFVHKPGTILFLKCFFQRRIPAYFQVVADPDGIEMLVLAQYDARLPLKKGNFFFGVAFNRRAGFPVQEVFDHLSFHGRIDNPGDVHHLQLRVKIVSRFDDDERVHFAKPQAACNPQGQFVVQILFQDLALDDPDQIIRATGLAAGAPADNNTGFILIRSCQK